MSQDRQQQVWVPAWPRRRARTLVTGLAAVACLGAALTAAVAVAEGIPPFRFSFSACMFRQFNENDAKAALKAYTQALMRERQIEMDLTPMVLDGAAAIARALCEKRVEIASVTAPEFLALAPALQPATVMLSVTEKQGRAQYLLLVRRDRPFRTFADLKGRHLLAYENARTSLAPAWLDILQKDAGVAPNTATFFSRVEHVDKPSRAVLPVFFGQVDVCLVTQAGFSTMVELNPQLGKQLHAVATSPVVVPMVAFFRADYDAEKRQKLRDLLLGVQLSVAGRQLLTLFEADNIEEAPVSCLDSARELLEKSGRLATAAVAGGQMPPTRAPEPVPAAAATPGAP